MLNPREAEGNARLLESLGFEASEPKPASIRAKLSMTDTNTQPAITLPDLSKYEEGTVFYFALSGRTTAFILGDKRHFIHRGSPDNLGEHGFVRLG